MGKYRETQKVLPDKTVIITQELLVSRYRYDPFSGSFTRRKNGKRADIRQREGYWRLEIYVNGRRFCVGAHRAAWLYVTGEWPTYDIDHVDLDGLNNKWENLREATRSQNLANRRLMKHNRSGYKGVSFCRKDRRWKAWLSLDGRNKCLGAYDAPETAYRAYCETSEAMYGEFHNPG